MESCLQPLTPPQEASALAVLHTPVAEDTHNDNEPLPPINIDIFTSLIFDILQSRQKVSDKKWSMAPTV